MRVVRGFGMLLLSLLIMALLLAGVMTDYRDEVNANRDSATREKM